MRMRGRMGKTLQKMEMVQSKMSLTMQPITEYTQADHQVRREEQA